METGLGALAIIGRERLKERLAGLSKQQIEGYNILERVDMHLVEGARYYLTEMKNTFKDLRPFSTSLLTRYNLVTQARQDVDKLMDSIRPMKKT